MPHSNNRRTVPGEGNSGSHFESASSTLSDAIASTTAYFSPFAHSSPSLSGTASQPMPEHNRLLAEVAPHIMRPRILSAAVAAGNTMTNNVSNSALIGFLPLTRTGIGGYSMSQPARSLVRLGNQIRQGPVTSTDLKALESSYQILSSINAANLDEEIQEPKGVAKEVSLLRGFQATLPSNLDGRARRRKQRGRDDFHLGLKEMSDNARGLLINGSTSLDNSIEEDGGLLQQKQKEKRKARRSLANKAKEVPLTLEELQGQKEEIAIEKENLSIRRMLINSEVAEVEARIASLELVKQNLAKSLLGLREEELELNDELDGVSELLAVMKHRRAMPGGSGKEVDRIASSSQGNSRRRKGPLFLPSEHDELPSGVAFMTLSNHTAPITALDFSEPYGTLVSAALDDTVRVWDLSSASEVGRLRGHVGTVKCLQVEDELCITGGSDSSIRLWDLHRVEDFETRLNLKESGELSAIKDSNGEEEKEKEHDPCLRTLEGHSKAVTSLYFDDTCLVTGASDKTLRQWDLNTGQCVLTMDILWAISNPTSSQSLVSDAESEDNVRSSPIRARHSIATMSPSNSANSVLMAERNYAGAFSHPTPAFADGSWEMYQDFVGGVQFWGYALASGSGDGAVRMWDSKLNSCAWRGRGVPY